VSINECVAHRFAAAGRSSGEGKLFSFDLLDEKKGEIRCTAFGAECDK
jgi:hypothetical protein